MEYKDSEWSSRPEVIIETASTGHTVSGIF